MPTSKRGWTIPALGALASAGAIFAAVRFGTHAAPPVPGAPRGGPACASTAECPADHRCVAPGRCSRACKSDGDCPAGRRCGELRLMAPAADDPSGAATATTCVIATAN